MHPIAATGAGLGALLVFVMPISLLLMALKQRGPADRFRRAGALTPETARKPASLEITRHLYLENAIRRGELVAVGDGRYYLDLDVHRRRRGRLIAAAAILTVAGAAVCASVWWPF